MTDPATRAPDGGLLDRIGLPKPLVLGYIGVLLFMIGDGVESGFIAPYMADHGAGTDVKAGYVITAYGVAVMLASWFSGALSEVWGPRKVMWVGLGIWAVFDALYLVFALGTENYPMMLILYGIRGFGYPLFAFGFLVWITGTAPKARLGTAVGWFYFAFTGGLPTLGSLWSSFTIPAIGEMGTLWSALGLILLGGAVALVGAKRRAGGERLADPGVTTGQSLFNSVSIVWTHPRVLVGCLVRIINTAPEFGMLVYLPRIFSDDVGFGTDKWLQLLAIIYGTNIFFNLIFGAVSDKIGWRTTIATFGAFGCAISVTVLYFVPTWLGPDYYWVAVLAGMLYGATLAGFVPISALIPNMAPDNKGGAMALLNLGAGGAAFVGPAIASLFLPLVGAGGVTIVFLVLYLVAMVLTFFLKMPEEQGGSGSPVAASPPGKSSAPTPA
ncbi:MFS transporter [Streptomyces smyrnaeus]|uniref:MFS transporter n=1 Tax=Streptomyces TaxID=1883 RepID=UPI000C18D8B9|nr:MULTISPECIES: MFS transporter [unclassified Streptomyces]MBQ0866698.1 MFS transporter [Streptomyces sp. RK75]MBQ1125130.1 MFS transporter [Streptomyces sp. B15]MBQ1161392.1 MFS transporter [Streptomyces sp. A73]